MRRGCDEDDYLEERRSRGVDGGAKANSDVAPRIGRAAFEDEDDEEEGGDGGMGVARALHPSMVRAPAAVNPYARNPEESEGQEDADNGGRLRGHGERRRDGGDNHG
ncbi:hypothetical protein ACHAWF_004655 [Thalassiosira exigua]